VHWDILIFLSSKFLLLHPTVALASHIAIILTLTSTFPPQPQGRVHIRVLDEDQHTNDDLLGVIELDLSTMMPYHEIDDWDFEVEAAEGQTVTAKGTVCVSYK
tara:strand:+ start:1040 stop:1348 length:309 start_codon:yes stop_codon:yes gene_type:complete